MESGKEQGASADPGGIRVAVVDDTGYFSVNWHRLAPFLFAWTLRRDDAPMPDDAALPRLESLSLLELEVRLGTGFTPDLVISLALARRFDCDDVARCLVRHHFAGRNLAIARGLPNAAVIRGELRAANPGLDLTVLRESDIPIDPPGQ